MSDVSTLRWSGQRNGPAYVPREHGEARHLFGRYDDLDFGTLGDDWSGEVLAGAARFQHEFVLAVREALARDGRSVTWLATESGLEYRRLSALVRGEVPMRLVDIAAISLVVGIEPTWVRT